MHTPIAIYFVLLFFGLLLGDGKQSTIEIYGVSVLIVCWIYYACTKKYVWRIPMTLGLPWIVFGLSGVLSTIQSDSVGLSLSWIVRLASGYLAYRLFYSIASKQTARSIVRSLAVFVAGAALLSLLVTASSPVRSMLPSMNLLELRFGHNHLADLLVFIAPIVFSLMLHSRRSKLVKAAVMLGYIVFLLLTYARGAWLIVAVYGAAAYVVRGTHEKTKRALIAATTIAIISIASYGSTRVFMVTKDIPRTGTDASRAVRPFTLESRLEYWRQALVSIKERPAFGSGPGTFSLTSTRLQKRVNQSSWFAHSTLLQTGSEMGVLGLLAFLWLIGAHAQLYIKNSSAFSSGKPETAILWGLVLMFVYGLFEYVLDYHIIWLLFWSAVGLTAGIVRTNSSRVPTAHISISVPFASVSLFYLLWILSGCIALTTKRYDQAFYVAPFDAGNALVMLSTHDVTQAEPNVALALVFHKNNPQVLKELAAYYTKRGYDEKAQELLSRVIQLDSKNTEGYALYDETAHRRMHPLSFIDQTQLLTKGFLPSEYSQQLMSLVTCYGANDLEIDRPHIDLRELSEYTIEEPIAEAIYLIGSRLVDKDKEGALSFWELSSRIDPDLSFYAVERANLLAKEGRLTEAFTVLDQCRTNIFANRHCTEFRQQITDNAYLPVGFYTEYMQQSLPFIIYEESTTTKQK